MKIIFITDIHGGFNRVANLLFETVADIYIVAGDLIDIPFYSIDTAIHYYELQNYFTALRRRMEKEDMILEDFVESLLEIPDISEEIQSQGSQYQQYTIRARRVMQQKYKVLETLLSFKTSAKIFALPGNYDMDLKFTSLHERDLHLRWYNHNGIKIAGYGGADVWTAGIPEKYIIKYNAGRGIHDKKNEMYTFFKAVKPQIIVAHQPAQGIHDKISYIGPSGSPALRTFCDTHDVKLCLTGHIHNDWGFEFSEETIYLNPSNFGEVTTAKGDVSEGGFFYEIEMDEEKISSVKMKKIVETRIYDIMEYTQNGTNWKDTIIDSDRLKALSLGKNYDSKTEKYSHIPEIQLFQEIKQFFRLFQTEETEKRISKLESAVELMQGKLDDIAMDIVGSVNLGISEKSSDIDIVLYLRCGLECPALIEQCNHFQKTKQLISKYLGDKYKFEIIDCIDLSIVENSIREENYECETTQRFVTYRSICRPINYKIIAPVEDLLNSNIEYRKEMEGSIRSYFKIFVTTSQHLNSFDKYQTRLKTIGIKIPKPIEDKIKAYLSGTEK